ncbi:MAG: dihydrofolate reductase [Legionellales bacterium]|nr:dihydrofolate reductase [Legionellales bacterium]
MPKISLIVAVDEQGGIGKGQELLCYLPADLAFFKVQTMGKPMVMGRRTYESIGRPLPGRRSIVLTTQNMHIPNVEIVHNEEEALALCQHDPEVMAIGGSSVYRQFLPMAHHMYVTLIHHTFSADVFFPKFDAKLWTVSVLKEFAADEKNIYNLTFMRYDRV